MSFLIDVDQLRQACSENRASAENYQAERDDLLQLLMARELLLLRQTLEYAAQHVDYYQTLFKQENFKTDDFRRLRDLRRLPILSKKTVGSHLDDFISKQETLNINSMVSTSGTTSNFRLPRFISEEEMEACALLDRISSNGRNPGGDILLRVFPAMRRYMGYGRHANFPQIVVTLSLHYPKHSLRASFDDFVLRQLFERFPIPRTTGRVTVVHTTPPYLIRIISEEMTARNLSPQDTRVRGVACTGGLITNRLRRLVKDYWQVPLLTSYSLTEFNGWAVGCALHPNRYHFNATIYAEIVDPKTYKPVAEDQEGLLILTSLYPFQQAQLFIRYDTGDLVAYKGRQCECGFVGTSIEFRGRLEHCIDLGDMVSKARGRRFLASADVHNLLEDMPEVPSLLYPRFEMKRIDREDSSVTIRLNVEVNQIVNASMEKETKRRMLGELRLRYPEWGYLVKQGRLSWDIQLYNRGEMSSFFKMYPES